MKKFTYFMVSMFMMFSLAACNQSGSGDKAVIGLNFDLTDVGAQYGAPELEGAKLAIKLFNENGGFNGKDVEFISLDSKSDPMEAYQAQTRLAEEGVFAVVGSTISSTSASAIKAAGEQEVPTVTPSATADLVTNDGTTGLPYGYRVCYSDSFQAVTMANFAVNTKGFKKVGIIADNSSEYAQGLTKMFKEQMAKLGGTIVFEEFYTAGDKDFSTILTKVKANTEVEALFIPGYYNEVGPILRQAHTLSLNLPILGVDGYDSADFKELATPEALNNVFYSNHYSRLDQSPARLKFVEAYKAEYGKEPIGFAALSFDATNLVLEALVRANSTDPKKVNEEIEKTVDFKGVTGSITIDDLHNARKSTFVVELKNGDESAVTIVEP